MPVYSVKTAAGWLDAVKRYSGMAPRAVASLFQHNPKIHPALDIARDVTFGSPINLMQDLRRPGSVGRAFQRMYNPLYKDPVTGKRFADLVDEKRPFVFDDDAEYRGRRLHYRRRGDDVDRPS